jgi:protocatechuate 3,4-dioxygenase beta subunit
MSKNQNRSITRVGLEIAERRSNLSKRVGQLVQPKRRLLMSASKLFTRAMAATAIILIATIGSVQIIGRQAAADDAQAAANKTDESNTTGEELTQVKSTALAPPLPPAPGVEPITYIGKVVDSVTGEPLAGAKVQIKHELSREPGTDKWVLIEMTEYTTDKDGSYQFTLPPEQVAQGSLYLEVNAHHPSHQSMGWGGYAHSMIRTNIEKGDPPFFATIKLEPGQEITGVVVAPDGKALSDVQIATYTKKQIGATTTNLFDGGSFQKTATDLNGHFRLVVATPGDGVIWIYPKDFAAEAHRLRDRRGDLGTFRLKQGTTISGRVLDENGTPVAGVGVDVRRDGDGAEADEYLGRNAVANGIGAGTNTREDGTFTLHPLPPGKYEMEVAVFATDRTAPDRDWFETFGKTLPHVFTRQKIEIAEGLREQSVILQAVRHATIRGRYVDGQGQPRTGHEQRIAGDINGSTFYGQSTRAGVDGRFEFRVPAGIENVQITASTNEHSSLRWKIAGMKTLTYGYHINLGKIEHDVDGLEIVRYNAPILLIKAVDEHGDQVKEYDVDTEYIVGPEPVNGTVTQALQYPTGSIGLERQGDGRMRSSQMLPDAETTITVTKDGFESQPQSVSLKEGETRELTFVLKKRDADSAIP